jgi:hypothetical protein
MDWKTPITLADAWESANFIGADSSFTVPRTADTPTVYATQSGEAIKQDSGEGWSGFWRDTIGGIVAYGIQRDAAKQNMTQPAPGAPYQPVSSTTKPTPSLGLGTILLIGAVAFVAFKVAK